MEGPAPANGLKLIAIVVGLFALAAAYGQWEHLHRPQAESAIILPAPTVSPTASPEGKP